MAERMRKYRVGDRVSVIYVDHIEPGTPRSSMPVIEGTITELPNVRRGHMFYELTVDDDAIREAGGYVDEDGEGLPYLAAPSDIIGLLPKTFERTDVEAWLASS